MTGNQIYNAQKTRFYKRMGIGSILGGFIFLTAGLGLAWFGNNMNPVAGMGVLVLATFGVVAGALMGTLTIPKKPSDEAKRREDNFRDFKESISIMIATLRNQESITFD